MALVSVCCLVVHVPGVFRLQSSCEEQRARPIVAFRVVRLGQELELQGKMSPQKQNLHPAPSLNPNPNLKPYTLITPVSWISRNPKPGKVLNGDSGDRNAEEAQSEDCQLWSLGSIVFWGGGFRVLGGLGCKCRVWGLGFRIWGLEPRA